MKFQRIETETVTRGVIETSERRVAGPGDVMLRPAAYTIRVHRTFGLDGSNRVRREVDLYGVEQPGGPYIRFADTDLANRAIASLSAPEGMMNP